jgi:hypothetical protein
MFKAEKKISSTDEWDKCNKYVSIDHLAPADEYKTGCFRQNLLVIIYQKIMIVLQFAIIILGLSSSVKAWSPGDSKPHIIYIMADDLGIYSQLIPLKTFFENSFFW